MPDAPDLIVTVLMHPVGKGRARSTKTGRTFVDPKTVNAEQAVRHAWAEGSGSKKLGAAPLKIVLVAAFERPKYHFDKDEKVKEEWAYAPCMKAPDLDNLLKLMCDALNGYAWRDDKQIVQAKATKLWAGQQGYLLPQMVLYARRWDDPAIRVTDNDVTIRVLTR